MISLLRAHGILSFLCQTLIQVSLLSPRVFQGDFITVIVFEFDGHAVSRATYLNVSKITYL